jgi:dephospho-CoA kinase
MARDGVTAAEAEARLAAQLPIEAKVARADAVVWTTGTHEETERQVDAVLSRYLQT